MNFKNHLIPALFAVTILLSGFNSAKADCSEAYQRVIWTKTAFAGISTKMSTIGTAWALTDPALILADKALVATAGVEVKEIYIAVHIRELLDETRDGKLSDKDSGILALGDLFRRYLQAENKNFNLTDFLTGYVKSQRARGSAMDSLLPWTGKNQLNLEVGQFAELSRPVPVADKTDKGQISYSERERALEGLQKKIGEDNDELQREQRAIEKSNREIGQKIITILKDANSQNQFCTKKLGFDDYVYDWDEFINFIAEKLRDQQDTSDSGPTGSTTIREFTSPHQLRSSR